MKNDKVSYYSFFFIALLWKLGVVSFFTTLKYNRKKYLSDHSGHTHNTEDIHPVKLVHSISIENKVYLLLGNRLTIKF